MSHPTGAALLLSVATRTAVIFCALVLGIRGTGKRQQGELNSRDLVLVLIIANAVQNAMTEQNPSLLVGLVSASTLIALGWLLAVVTSRSPRAKRLLAGEPTLLVHDGRPLEKALKREGVTRKEVEAAARQLGVDDLAGCKLAVLEVDGTITVVAK